MLTSLLYGCLDTSTGYDPPPVGRYTFARSTTPSRIEASTSCWTKTSCRDTTEPVTRPQPTESRPPTNHLSVRRTRSDRATGSNGQRVGPGDADPPAVPGPYEAGRHQLRRQ